MKTGMLLLLVAFMVAAGIWAAGCGGSGGDAIQDAAIPTQAPAEVPAVASSVEEPALLDLSSLETASAQLPREEAVLGDPSRTIRGRVLTLSGSPAAAAGVILWTDARDWTDPRHLLGAEERDGIRTVADEQGYFQFPNISPIEYGLTAEKGSHRRSFIGAYPGQYLEIRLGETGTVRGRLACAQHGAEIFSGVAVIDGGFFYSGYGAVPIRPDGSFELKHVPVGRSSVNVYVDRHVRISSSSEDLRRPGETVDILIELEPACTVRGKVIDVVTRVPIAGALVQGFSWVEGGGARTSADGSFILTEISREQSNPRIPPDQGGKLAHAIHAEAPGYLAGRAEVMLSAAEATAQEHFCTIALYAGIPISGRIVDARGLPLAGLHVTLTQGTYWRSTSGEGEPPDYSMGGRTDADGRFNIPWGIGRPTLLRIYSERLGVWVRNLGQFSGGRDLGDLQLPDPGSIPILVVDDGGAPIPMAQLSLTSKRKEDEIELAVASQPNSAWFQAEWQSAVTDSAGRCTLVFPPLFPAQIAVDIPDGVEDWEFPIQTRAADTREDLLLTLKGLRTITGRVRNVDKTSSRCELLIRPTGDTERRFTIKSDSDGAFRARAAFPDSFEALVSVTESDRLGVVVFSDLKYSAKPLDLMLPEFLPVEGTIVDGKGVPVSKAGVRARMHGERLLWRSTADDQGRFHFSVPPQGKIDLTAVDLTSRHTVREGDKVTTVTAGQTGIVLVAPNPPRK